jgi:ribose transport system ATP-binding protein
VIGVIVGETAHHPSPIRPARTASGAAPAPAGSRQDGSRDCGPALEATDLHSQNLRGVTFTARSGRVLGIYGLVGAGRTNLLCALYGIESLTHGQVRLFGEPYVPRGPEAAIRAGIAYLPEERKLDGFVPKLTAVTNVTLPVLERYSHASVLSLRRAGEDARRSLAEVDVRGEVDAPMEDLSGGNQQKVLFARAMLQRPRLLLLDEPTKGVDLGAKREIHGIVRSFVRDPQVAAIVVSSEEEEILALADEILVFHNGMCDGTGYRPSELKPGDLRRLAWTAGGDATSAVP